MTTVTIAKQFNGPDDSGNGGYCAGLFAQVYDRDSQRAIEVTLRNPPPLDQALTITSQPQGAQCHDGDTVIAQIQHSELVIDIPSPIDLKQAVEASKKFSGFVSHPFSHCYVCGPDRAEHDGLRIFAGPVEGRELAACPWQPFEALADSNGNIAVEHIWAALDCPSYFGATINTPQATAFLGRITLQIYHQNIAADQTYIICAWPNGTDERKLFGGVGLFDQQGNCLAAANATWIALKTAP